ncbi:MAG: TatD DNase family protein [Myxococcota bacterium]|jgi:TatD DNase family protein
MFDAMSHLYRCLDPTAALAKGRAAGVDDVLLAGVDPEGWRAQSALAGPGVHVAYGCHPWHATGEGDAVTLEAALSDLATPVAVGEIGLDGSGRHRSRLAVQETSFVTQLDLAQQQGLPVILHVVRAHGAALDGFDRCPAPSGVVHGFSGSMEVARQWLSRGFLLSFGPLVCNEKAKRARIAAAQVPLDRLLIESDAPSHFEDSAGIIRVLESLSALRPETVAQLAKASRENACRLFGVDNSHR